MSKQLEGRIALITGATRGIGYAVAKRYAKEGAHVIATGRSVKGLEQLDDEIKSLGGTATLVPLDITETDKLELMAQGISQRFGKLDILVGNAGVLGEITPMAHTAPEQWNKVIAINLTANYHLLRCFDMLLKLSTHPRAMFVSSGVTEGIYPYWGAYAVSKSALEKMVETYAAENAKTPVKANLIDPGGVRTKMRAAAFPGEDPDTLPHPDDITDIFVKLANEKLTETGKKFHT